MRGEIDTRKVNGDKMREILGSHSDVKRKKVKHQTVLLIEEKGHIVYTLPKFHYELNPIERRAWAQ